MIPPPAAPTDVRYRVQFGLDSKIVCKHQSVTTVIHKLAVTISEKTDYTAVFHSTTNIHTQPLPVTNINRDFPSSTVKVQDFFSCAPNSRWKTSQDSFCIHNAGNNIERSSQFNINTLKDLKVWFENEEIDATRTFNVAFMEKKQIQCIPTTS